MKFSIVLATLNRSEIINVAIKSIINQNYKNYEIIIIDQSTDDKTKKIMENFIDDKKIFYYQVDFKGLSRARNFGIYKSQGDYICLMDDDAEYQDDFLMKAVNIIEKKNVQILSGIVKDKKSGNTFSKGMEKQKDSFITMQQIGICVSASLVLCKQMILDINGFDEELGVGAKFSSGEETDILLRCIYNKKNIYYSKELMVYHPEANKQYDNNAIERAYKYGLGEGALYKKHLGYKKFFKYKFTYVIIKTFFACIVYAFILNIPKFRFYSSRLRGILKGYFDYGNI